MNDTNERLANSIDAMVAAMNRLCNLLERRPFYGGGGGVGYEFVAHAPRFGTNPQQGACGGGADDDAGVIF